MIPAYVHTEPALLDIMMLKLVQKLPTVCDYIQRGFGFAQQMVDNDTKYPAIFINKEYYSLLPDDSYGNYFFGQLIEPYELSKEINNKLSIDTKVELIFFVNVETTGYTSAEADSNDYRQNIINDVTKAIVSSTVIAPGGHITVNRVFLKHENIFGESAIKLINSQYLMHPYFAFKVECNFKYRSRC